MDRFMVNIATAELNRTKDFYVRLFGFQVEYDSDWFVHLESADTQLELGIILENNEYVPDGVRGGHKGFYLTFVVSDLDQTQSVAVEQGYKIVEEPKDTAYGQRRMLLNDPNGVAVDVSSPVS
ncbi:MAG: VOC family protein [Bacteroidia bacterium]|nr:VOC family protein [Bacteroidia bacterium]